MDSFHSYEQLRTLSLRASLGSYTAGIIHELNNPLAIIQGYLEQIQFFLSEINVFHPKITRGLQLIQDSILRISTLLDSLRRITRLTTHPPEMADIRELLEDILTVARGRLRTRKIEVEASLSYTPPIRMNTADIVSVLLALLTNAIDSLTEAGGGILYISCSHSVEKGYCIEIIDTGLGISEEVKARLGTPFYSSRTTPEHAGTGLYLVNAFIKSYGADFSLENQEGGGVRAVLTFPPQ